MSFEWCNKSMVAGSFENFGLVSRATLSWEMVTEWLLKDFNTSSSSTSTFEATRSY